MDPSETHETHETHEAQNAENGPASLHAICLEVADRAQAVAWQAYLQARRPNAGIAAGLGVLAAYLRLGGAVEALLNALADAERPAERRAEERRGPR